MTSFQRTRFATAATALVFGAGLGFPATAAAAGTVTAASQNSSSCTQNNVTTQSDQTQVPWEIGYANPSHLTDASGDALDGSGVTVAVIDTGIQAQTQLSVSGGEVLNGESRYDADDDGHGTMVASIIAAKKVTGSGTVMQGIAPGVRLHSVRAAGSTAVQGDGNTEDSMADAVNYAVANGAQVINISQDGYDPDTKLYNAIQNAYQSGVIVVTSAGNQGDKDTTDSSGKDYGVNPRTYPASYPDVLAVGAVDQNGMVPTFSETGSAANTYFVGVAAPGVSVGGLLPNGKIATDDGTSFASPYVAAEAALIIQEHHWAGDDTASRAYDVIKIIEATADGGGAYSSSEGWGEADIQAALTTQLTDGSTLVATGSPISGLPKMLGVGPNADGAAATSNSAAKQVAIKPYVASAANNEAQNQQRWAYMALGGGLLVAVVTLAGAAVARDTARRRSASQP